jgi:hypothetical protein
MSYTDFSGASEYSALCECEKIDLIAQNRTWIALPDMEYGRFSFNPCLFRRFVYLCGVGSLRVEAFSPQTDSFQTLHLINPLAGCSCLYAYKALLVLCAKEFMAKFSAKEDGQLTQLSLVPTKRLLKSSNTQPVVNSVRGVVFIVQNGRCLSFSLETGVLEQDFA